MANFLKCLKLNLAVTETQIVLESPKKSTTLATTMPTCGVTVASRLKETSSSMSDLELQALQQYRTSEESMDEKFNQLEREAQEQYPY